MQNNESVVASSSVQFANSLQFPPSEVNKNKHISYTISASSMLKMCAVKNK